MEELPDIHPDSFRAGQLVEKACTRPADLGDLEVRRLIAWLLLHAWSEHRTAIVDLNKRIAKLESEKRNEQSHAAL